MTVHCVLFALAQLKQCRKKMIKKKAVFFGVGVFFSAFNLNFKQPPSALLFKRSFLSARNIHKQNPPCSNYCILLICPLIIKIQGGCRRKKLVCIKHTVQKTRQFRESTYRTSLFVVLWLYQTRELLYNFWKPELEILTEASVRKNFLGISHI